MTGWAPVGDDCRWLGASRRGRTFGDHEPLGGMVLMVPLTPLNSCW